MIKIKRFLVSSILACGILLPSAWGQDFTSVEVGLGRHNLTDLSTSYVNSSDFSSPLWYFSADAVRTFDVGLRLRPRLGLGLSYLAYDDEGNISSAASEEVDLYLNLQYGVDLPLRGQWDRMALQLMLSHHRVAGSRPQESNQRVLFTNANFGIAYSISEDFALALSAAYSIHPVYVTSTGAILDSGEIVSEQYQARMRGLNLTAKWRL